MYKWEEFDSCSISEQSFKNGWRLGGLTDDLFHTFIGKSSKLKFVLKYVQVAGTNYKRKQLKLKKINNIKIYKYNPYASFKNLFSSVKYLNMHGLMMLNLKVLCLTAGW